MSWSDYNALAKKLEHALLRAAQAESALRILLNAARPVAERHTQGEISPELLETLAIAIAFVTPDE